MSAADVRALRARLDGLTIVDAARLGRRLKALRGPVSAEKFEHLTRQISAAEQLFAARAAAVPAISYPDLPVSERRDELTAAIRDHQVVIVAGETGSGKTTQLPKICLEAGRGVRGTIGHTQPRRLAARTVAQRIADELGVALGDAVGYTVRFTDQASDRTLVKLMTDGILLAEIARDRQLLRYDTLILDEAHERSLNIDFLLGYLQQLLPRRPDLKVIVTSATIEPERFAAHFASVDGGAPIIEVSGRTYPVEVRYMPLVTEEDDFGFIDGAVAAVENALIETNLHPVPLTVGRRHGADTHTTRPYFEISYSVNPSMSTTGLSLTLLMAAGVNSVDATTMPLVMFSRFISCTRLSMVPGVTLSEMAQRTCHSFSSYSYHKSTKRSLSTNL